VRFCALVASRCSERGVKLLGGARHRTGSNRRTVAAARISFAVLANPRPPRRVSPHLVATAVVPRGVPGSEYAPTAKGGRKARMLRWVLLTDPLGDRNRCPCLGLSTFSLPRSRNASCSQSNLAQLVLLPWRRGSPWPPASTQQAGRAVKHWFRAVRASGLALVIRRPNVPLCSSSQPGRPPLADSRRRSVGRSACNSPPTCSHAARSPQGAVALRESSPRPSRPTRSRRTSTIDPLSRSGALA